MPVKSHASVIWLEIIGIYLDEVELKFYILREVIIQLKVVVEIGFLHFSREIRKTGFNQMKPRAQMQFFINLQIEDIGEYTDRSGPPAAADSHEGNGLIKCISVRIHY